MTLLSNSAAQDNATKVLADVYHFSGASGRFEKCQLVRKGIFYSLEPTLTASLETDGTLRINRLILRPEDGTLPLAVDVDPESSGIKISADRKTVDLDFAVRNVWFKTKFTNREAVEFRIRLRFSVLVINGKNEGRDYEKFESHNLENHDLIKDYGPRLSEVLSNSSLRQLEKTESELNIGEKGLGVKWKMQERGEMRFRKSEKEKLEFYTVEFHAQLLAEERDKAQLLRGFNQNFIANRFNRGFSANPAFPDADELIVFETEQPVPEDWIGHQYPTDELRPDQPPPLSPGDRLPHTSWIITIEGVPPNKAVNVWNAVVSGFHNSLHTVKAGNRVSFLPAFSATDCVVHDPKDSSKPPQRWRWAAGYFLLDAFQGAEPEYHIEGGAECKQENKLKCAKLTAFSLWPLEQCDLTAIFPGLFDEARQNISGRLTVLPPEELQPPQDTEKYKEYYPKKFLNKPGLEVRASQLTFNTESSIRLGALDLHLNVGHNDAARETGNSFFRLFFERNSAGRPLEERQLNVSLGTSMSLSRVLPGGEDAPSSSEFKTSVDPHPIFRRDAPLILPWGRQNDPRGLLFIKIKEDAGQQSQPNDPVSEYSDTVNIELHNQRPPEPFDQKLIIIDPDPFTVVAVKFKSFESQGPQQTNKIGEWNNNGAKWQLVSLDDHFSLVLPPQVLGEEMEKHRTIPRGAAINFRLSPPTQIAVSQTEFAQSFREPPWNLRRILEPEDPQASGARILFMQYELLYGLSCNFNTSETNVKNLRLMELFRRFGHIPGAINTQESDKQTSGELREGVLGAIKNWRTLFHQYRARIGVFMPWEPSNEHSLILNEGIQCIIRRNYESPEKSGEGADLAHPLDTENFMDLGTIEQYTDRLRGGTTWGFESRNIFTAVTRPNPNTGKIESNTARLIDPQFSSLGGWGNVRATFDNNRSAIYGDASMGRTYSYTLERIGRIGCFWNIAKHVIVYERHVANSKQFVCQQDELAGLPLLRKTHEYVVILEPIRNYPENPLAPPMQRGFVNGCYFAEKQRINVDSQWGSDVGSDGWKVPLWNPAARQDVYPKPVFSLGLQADAGGKETSCPCELDNPENVFFYTSTDPNLKADPNIWDAVLDVDYVNLPQPQPQEGEYPNGSLLPVRPGDPPVPSGFKPCTFRVQKPASPINLVAERADKPLSTVVQNVTVMRAGIRQLEADANDAFSHLHNLRKNASDIYAEIFKTLPEKGTEEVAAIKTRIAQVIESQKANIDGLHGQIKEIQSQVVNQIGHFEPDPSDPTKSVFKPDKFIDRVLARERQLLDTFGRRLTSFTGDVVKEYRNTLEALIASQSPQLKQQVQTALDRLFQKTVDTIFMVPTSSSILRRVVEQFRDAAISFKERYEQLWNQFLADVDKLPGSLHPIHPLGAAERRSLRELVEKADAEIQVLRSKLEIFKPWLPETWIPDPKPARDEIQNALKAFDPSALNSYVKKLDELKAAVERQGVNEIKTRADEIRQSVVAAFAGPISRIDALVSSADDVQGKVRKRAVEFIGDPHLPCTVTSTSVYCQLRKKVDETDLSQLINTADELNRLVSEDAIKALVKDLKDKIIDGEEQAKLKALADSFARNVLNDVNGLFNHFDVAALKSAVDAAVQKAETAFNDLSDLRKSILDKVNSAYEDNYKSLQEAKQVFQSADKALRLVRAFGAPPAVPNLSFDRPEVAFFYKEAQRVVDVTPVLARVNQVEQAADSLKALGVKLPTKQLLNDLIPKPLEDFDLRKIFPDFAGLKLENLLPGLKMPSIANDRVRISHGIDAQTRRAWVQAVVDDVQITTPTTLFTIGPVELAVPKSSFSALTRFEAAQGESPKRQINAKIMGDWDVRIGGQSMIVFQDTALTFDDAAGLKFRIEPSRIKLNGILTFVSDLLSKFGGKDSGLSFGLLPDGGIQCVLSLPVPDVQFGAFGISHLHVGAVLALRLSDAMMGGGFSIELCFNLGRKEAPFALTVFLLGGGGYLELCTRYAPATGRLMCIVSLGLTVSASLAIALGPIHGGVYIYFGITAEFIAGGGAKFAIGVLLLMRGEVSLLGIVEASISLLLEAQYDTTSGQIIGHGKLSISIKICWCFTLEINEEITYTVGEGSKNSARLQGDGDGPVMSAHAVKRPALPATTDYHGLVTDYIHMLA
jgi:hypothetical protein